MRLTFFDSFEFGISKIDQGHRQILYLFNEIGDCLRAKNYDTALRQVIHLIAVERKHVGYETKILEQYDSNMVAKHEKYHVSLYRSLGEIMVALGDQDSEAAGRCYEELRKNIVDDILEADLPFKSLLQDRILGR